MALIEMKGVTKKYRRSTTALRDINVSVDPGEFVYIVGPSGAGKSSFIKLLYREEKVSAGSLKVGEFDLTKLKKRQKEVFSRVKKPILSNENLIEALSQIQEKICYL